MRFVQEPNAWVPETSLLGTAPEIDVTSFADFYKKLILIFTGYHPATSSWSPLTRKISSDARGPWQQQSVTDLQHSSTSRPII